MQNPPFAIPKKPIIDLGEVPVNMSINALVKTAEYILEHRNDFNVGDHFTLTGIDGKRVKMLLKQ